MNKIYHLEKIETPRLIIRPVQLGDAVPLNRAVNHSLTLLQQWQPWANDPSLQATQDFVQHGVTSWKTPGSSDFPMTIIHQENNKIIGASGYNDRSDPKEGVYDIGYWLDIDYQGQGLVTEYVNALSRFALLELNAKKVVICMNVENIKSIAIAKRLSFSQTGTDVNQQCGQHYIFSCSDTKKLPDLKFICIYHDESHHDESKFEL